MVEAQKIVINELKRAAVGEIEVVQGGKHQQVRWRVNGSEPRFITIPGSPSDWRWEANLKADVRRMLREDGLLVADPAPAPAKPPNRLAQLTQKVRQLEERLAKLEARGGN